MTTTAPPLMERSFLLAYLDSFHRIEGWFDYEAALMFMAYNQILARHGVSGDVLEIGVHHGLSTIAIASLRGSGSRLYAVDLFEDLQNLNVSRSGGGDRQVFEKNMAAFYDDTSFIRVLTSPSRNLTPKDLGQSLSFCHIDGGHSRQETLSDLRLCHESMRPGGLVALDDYFNPEFPGVCEGAVEFMLEEPGALRPVAIGFHKVLFQKQPAAFDIAAEFVESFPYVAWKTVQMWDRPAVLFTAALRPHFDLQASTPASFRHFGSVPPRAAIEPERTALRARAGDRVKLPVRVTNKSREAFPHGEKVFGLSYHLLSGTGQCVQYDNDRVYFRNSLKPGETVDCDLAVRVPPDPGEYCLELDLVWEGLTWFHGIGNPTAQVGLSVQ